MNTQNIALLVMDFQVVITGRYPTVTAALEQVVTAIAHARSKEIPVIYVVVGFRKGMPEVATTNKNFTASKATLGSLDPTVMMQIQQAVAPLDNDIIVTKRRYSAFTGSDLEVVLRSAGIQHLVLTGITTSGVVLSTVREASDKDYILTVLSDGCTDGDEEVHHVLMTKVFPTQATVITVKEWIAGIG